MIWVESLTNPMLRHTDLEAVIKIARRRKVGYSQLPHPIGMAGNSINVGYTVSLVLFCRISW